MTGIIILNYFNSDLVAKLLKSFSEQNVSNPICIVDNSCDPTEARIINNLISNENVVANLLVNKKNLGYFNGNLAGGQFLVKNYGATHCLIINPDVSSNQWAYVIEVLKKNFISKQVFIVGPKIIIPGYKDVSSPLLKFHPYWEFLISIGFPFSHIVQRYLILRNAETSGSKFSVEGSAYMIDLEKMLLVADVFSNIFLYGEEIIYGLLARKFDWKIIYDNTVEVQHHHPPRTRSNTYEKYLVESMDKILVKFYSPSRFFRYFFSISFIYKFNVRSFIMKLLRK